MIGRRSWVAAVGLPFLLACATTIPIPLVQSVPPDAREVLRGGRRTALLVADARGATGAARAWAVLLEGTLEREFVRRGFFVLVDPGARRDRLSQLALSFTGAAGELKRLGRELAVDNLLLIGMPRAPLRECRIEIVFVTRTVTNPDGTTRTVTEAKPTGVLYFTVFLDSHLVNVETGAELSFSYAEPVRSQNHAGITICPGYVRLVEEIAAKAAASVADRTTPTVMEEHVPIEDSARIDGKEDQRHVAELADAAQWMAVGNALRAGEAWESARRRVGERSPALAWNLALYYWKLGRHRQADRKFKLYLGLVPEPSRGRMRIISAFDRELELLGLAEDGDE